MYLSLIRKDFSVLFRGNVKLILLQMLFILFIISANLGIIGYSVMVTSFGWQLLMMVSLKDKMNHSLALLLSMPYDKKKIINARYASAIIGFFGVTIIYEVLVKVLTIFQISLLQPLTGKVVLLTFCAYTLFISLTIPLYLKFDDSIVKGISLFTILGVTVIGVLIWDKTNLRFALSMTTLKEYFAMIEVVIILLSIFISRIVALKLFKRMEF